MHNTKNQDAVKEKGHTAVSLPRVLAAEVNSAAGLSGRSAAKELEHAFRIAQAVEQILPSATVHALKTGALPASELLAGLAAVLANPAKSKALTQVMDANPSRIHFDAHDPNKATLIKADGTKVEGRILENGEFIPGLANPSAPPVESDKHATRQRPAKTEKTPPRRRTSQVLEHA